MARILTASIALLSILVIGAGLAQDDVDQEPGIVQSRRMPRGRRARDEVTGAAGGEEPVRVSVPSKVKTISSAMQLMAENTPFPPRGFAKGTVEVIGDDSGPMGTYRLAFKYQGSGQIMPFIECKMFEAFENHLDEHGPQARRGALVVEVKGYVTTYRGTNFFFLHDYRMPKGALPGGGRPASNGSATTKPE